MLFNGIFNDSSSPSYRFHRLNGAVVVVAGKM